jgi:carboxymethylenebutenolidase
MSWNQFRTDQLGGMVAGVSKFSGGGGDQIHAYIARPDGAGPYPGVVLLHHAPGWDEFYREFARRFAEHGFIAICPNLYDRYGYGTPAEVTALTRAAGGVSDDSVVADAEAALNWIKAQPSSNGKVGVIGNCSGGRHAVLAASRVPAFDAVADLWGGGVIVPPERLSPRQPVAVIDLTPQLEAPLLGIFGNDDDGPSPAQVDQHEAVLKEYGKTYQFHRYDGADHSFMSYDRTSYRPQQAMDAWGKIVAWFDQYLA